MSTRRVLVCVVISFVLIKKKTSILSKNKIITWPSFVYLTEGDFARMHASAAKGKKGHYHHVKTLCQNSYIDC